jgi:hypothetical protein
MGHILRGSSPQECKGPTMKIYTFRCSNKSDLFAVSLNQAGSNLPGNICAGGKWVRLNEEEVEPGATVVGFVSRDLFRDLERQGFHLASGVRTTVSIAQTAVTTAVSAALSTANVRTRLFSTDTDA